MTRRRIAVVTGTRAEFGLLSRIISLLGDAPDVTRLVIATGAHLSETHGFTIREIEASGIAVDARVDLRLVDDSPVATAQAMGRGVMGFAEAYERLKPDLVVVLGDRYEILAAASAAAVCRIPVAHLHGGELTEGAIDDAVRHAVTKLSHLHFVAAPPYRERVLQLGEEPSRVHLVGGLGVDLACHTPAIPRSALEEATGYRFGPRNLVLTFHPVTLDEDGGLAELDAVLTAIGRLRDVHVCFTLPNADPGHSAVRQRIEAFADAHSHAWAFPSLGFRRYLSFVRESDGVVGNSSSGLIEAPAVGVGTVNVGTRQDGRLRASSVIDCAGDADSVTRALELLLSPAYRSALGRIAHPYGDGGAAERVVEVLREVALPTLLHKRFHDIASSVIAGSTT
jgi:GDP/UDP-N,N'-diacetylbacillosamine 2-epimerase (hydrolysing)